MSIKQAPVIITRQPVSLIRKCCSLNNLTPKMTVKIDEIWNKARE